MNRRSAVNTPHLPFKAALAVLCLLSSAVGAAGQDRLPVLSSDSDRYDFGEVLSGEVILKKIKIRNTGGADLELTRFEFSCGCSIPRAVLSTGETVQLKKIKGGRKLVLEPQAWAELELEFTSLGRKGQVVYKMVIHSNDPARPEVTIPIIAKVQPAFQLKPRVVKFGTLPKKSGASKAVTVTSVAAGAFEITGFSNLPPFMNFTVEKVEDGGAHAVRLRLALKGAAPAGDHNLVLKASIDSEKSRGLAIPITMKILPDVAFQCDGKEVGESINFGVLKKGEKTAKTIHILNKNPKIPYIISDSRLVSQYEKDIDVQLKTLRPGIEYELSITLKPGLEARFLRGFLHLTSDHPDLEKKRIILKGMYR